MRDLGPLLPTDVRVRGDSFRVSGTDIAIAGLGWLGVAVDGATDLRCSSARQEGRAAAAQQGSESGLTAWDVIAAVSGQRRGRERGIACAGFHLLAWMNARR